MEKETLGKDMTPVLLKDLGTIYPNENSKWKHRFGLYQCPYCNKEFKANTSDIKQRKIKSCGCLNIQKIIERNTSHGLRYHPLYTVWQDVKKRCYNKKHKYYNYYGGRGISVCTDWKDDFKAFHDWAIINGYQEGLSIDRIDVNGNYEPENCRWTTYNIQMQNTREIYRTNTSGFRGVSYDKKNNNWLSYISVNNKRINIGRFQTALEAAKAYERYVRLNNLEHNFTPSLTEDEIEEIYKDSK